MDALPTPRLCVQVVALEMSLPFSIRLNISSGVSPSLIFFTTFDDTNFPTRRAVGRHWDETIDGLTDAAVGIVGDGITGEGAWVTPNGAGDQILTDANYSGGAGGKGFRHWVGNGANTGGGGIQLSWTAVSEFWMRYYIRFQAGFSWGFPIEMKTIYCLPTQLGPFYFGLKDGTFGGHVQDDALNRNNGLGLMGIGNFYADGNWGWTDWQGGATGDGNFHRLELHVKGNTGGAQNGTLEWKLDGTLRGSYTDVRYGAGNPTFQSVAMGENHNDPESGSPSVDQYVDFDDIAISTSGWVGAYIP